MLKLFILLVWSVCGFAIVDITPVEVGENPELSGHLALGYEEKTGNTQIKQYDFSGKIQYDDNQSSAFFIQGYHEHAESGGVKIEQERLVHARYLYEYDERVYFEGFAQYNDNEFKGIDHRLLTGLGTRFYLFDTLLGAKVYLGLGAFEERINYNRAVILDEDLVDYRANTYIVYTGELNEYLTINLIGYYQPIINDIKDYYYAVLAELDVKIYENFHLGIFYESDYDEYPPQLISGQLAKHDRSVKTVLKWKF